MMSANEFLHQDESGKRILKYLQNFRFFHSIVIFAENFSNYKTASLRKEMELLQKEKSELLKCSKRLGIQ